MTSVPAVNLTQRYSLENASDVFRKNMKGMKMVIGNDKKTENLE
jgi:hypothetical protein